MSSPEAQISGPQFVQEYLARLPPGGVARHFQLFPGAYPSDVACGVLDEFVADEAAAAERYAVAFRGDFDAILSNGIALQRLCVLPSAEFDDTNPDYQRAELTMRMVAARTVGEVVRFARFGPSLVGDLLLACGDDSPLANRYLEGAQRRVPQASVWTALPTPQSDPIAARIMGYAYERPAHLLHSTLLLPPFDEDFRRYAGFWRGVFEDPSRSDSLEKIWDELS